MTKHIVGIAFLATLLMLAPAAASEADDGNTDDTRPDDAAWVEDCPPDMMCAYNSPEEDNVTRGEDCASCRYSDNDTCIDCTGGPQPADNTTFGTDCPPGVYCMVNGETDDPDDAGWVDCGGEVCAYDTPPEPASAEANEASAPAVLLMLSVVLFVVVALGVRRL